MSKISNTEIQREQLLAEKYGLEVTSSGSIKWTGEALLALMNKKTPYRQLRGSYKQHNPMVVYTLKLPLNQKQWLRQNPKAAKQIRAFINNLMNGKQISVIPLSFSTPAVSSLSSPSPPILEKNTIHIPKGVNPYAYIEALNSHECARCHEEFFTDESGVSDETEFVPGLGLCHKGGCPE